MRVNYKCCWCGKTVQRYPSQLKGKDMIFCSRECLAKFRSKKYNPENRPITRHPHLSDYNRAHNAERMTPEVREKISQTMIDTGTKDTYRKRHGRHEHRSVAEQILKRPLRKGEVVHHINRDKKDNRPENLMVFESQAEHARWHKQHDTEVRPNEVHTP